MSKTFTNKLNLKGVPMEAEFITSFTNEEDAIMSKVILMSKGYSVTLWCTDENEALPTSKIYPNEQDAIDYAKSLI